MIIPNPTGRNQSAHVFLNFVDYGVETTSDEHNRELYIEVTGNSSPTPDFFFSWSAILLFILTEYSYQEKERFCSHDDVRKKKGRETERGKKNGKTKEKMSVQTKPSFTCTPVAMVTYIAFVKTARLLFGTCILSLEAKVGQGDRYPSDI